MSIRDKYGTAQPVFRPNLPDPTSPSTTDIEDKIFEIAMKFANDAGTVALTTRNHTTLKNLYIQFANDILTEVKAATDEAVQALEIVMHHELDLLENTIYNLPADIQAYIYNRHREIEQEFESQLNTNKEA